MSEMRDTKRARVPGPSDEDLQRVTEVLQAIGGPHVQWGAKDHLDVWVAETRMEAERLTSQRLLFATWVLAGATVGLVLATIGLLVVTLGE